MNNIFSAIPAALPDELVEVLLDARDVRIERIVSLGHASPPGFWYDQDQAEWVVVLQGLARLRFANEEPIEMKPGDFINIPAHRRHRVEWTAPNEPTTLMSGRCIFFVHDLGDAFAGQLHAAGLTSADQGNFDAPLFDSRLGFGWRRIRNGDGGTFGQSRIAFQDHHAILHSTGNDHAVIICRRGRRIKCKT